MPPGSKLAMKKVPIAACSLVDVGGGCFAKAVNNGDKAGMEMKVYSGGKIQDHWFWGNLVIDLSGMSFPKKKQPILQDHDTSLKIGFNKGKPDVSEGFLKLSNITYVGTACAEEFQKLSDEGFPFEASIRATPLEVERIGRDEKVTINGKTFKGPLSIWRKSVFKEGSVCVFGWDRNTSSVTMSDEGQTEIDVKFVKGEITLSQKQENQEEGGTNLMTYDEFKVKHPELFAQVRKEGGDEVEAKMADDLKATRDKNSDLSARLESLSTTVTDLTTRVKIHDKDSIIRREADLDAFADEMWKTKLAKSDVAPHLYVKAIAMIDRTKFMKDDSTIDVEAFGKAIDDEIKDWETRTVLSPSGRIDGFGTGSHGKETISDDDASDEAWAEKMAILAGGKSVTKKE